MKKMYYLSAISDLGYANLMYETLSPIRTFTTTTISGKKYLVASNTCTPMVLFPMDELKAGQHVKGRTVAEMGTRNQPIDLEGRFAKFTTGVMERRPNYAHAVAGPWSHQA